MTIGVAALATALLAGPTVEAPAVPTITTMPTVAVELSMAPPAATPVWVDLGADFQTFTTRRGRQRELDRFQAGRFTVTLENSAGVYSPDNPSSPYAGHLKPMRRVRIRATYAGVTYPIIDGYVDSIEQQYEGPNVARAVIVGADAMLVLAAANLPTSAYAAEVAADEPSRWWRFDEQTDAAKAYEQIAGYDADVHGTVQFGEASLVARDPGGAMLTQDLTSSGVRNAVVVPPGGMPTGTGPFTIEFLTNGGAAPTFGANLLNGGGGTDRLHIHFPAIFFGIVPIQVTVGTTSVLSGYDPGDPKFNEGATHHVAVTRDDAGTVRLYVDGIDRTEVSSGTGVDATSLPAIPYVFGTDIVSMEEAFNGTLDELAVYDHALTPARIAAHVAAATTPWNDDLPGARAGRVLDIGGWPTDRRILDAGVTVLASANLDTNLLEYLYKVAESEFGALFVTAAGDVRLVARHALRNRDELHIFSDDPVAAGHLPYMMLRPEYTGALIRNVVTISRSEGVAQTARNETSIGDYLEHAYVLDGLLHDSDDLSRGAAQFIAAEYGEPLRRISALVVNPRTEGYQALLFPAILGLELTDEITAIERAPGTPTLTQDSVVEAVAHTVGPLSWTTNYQLSPAYADAFWQIGVPGASEIGVTTRVGF